MENAFSSYEMTDVVAALDQIHVESYRKHYFHVDDDFPTSCFIKSHFKGIACYSDKWIFTHTNLGVIRDGDGLYLVSDKGPIGEEVVECHTHTMSIHSGWLHGWSHPCGAQACGNFMAMGIQKDADTPSEGGSELHIYKRVDESQVIESICTIERDCNINGVAMTRLPNGKYIVAGIQDDLVVYISQSADDPTAFGDGIKLNPHDNDAPQPLGTGLAFVTQTKDGALYLISMSAEDDATDNKIRLHKIDMNVLSYSFVREIALPSHEAPAGPSIPGLPKIGGSCFRWGKGISITPPNTINIYASSRNVNRDDHTFNVIHWSNNA